MTPPASGPSKNLPAASDVEAWFQSDKFVGQSAIVAQWADAHNALAQAWAGPVHGANIKT
jgi:K+-transporting ATPase ATPase C chain